MNKLLSQVHTVLANIEAKIKSMVSCLQNKVSICAQKLEMSSDSHKKMASLQKELEIFASVSREEVILYQSFLSQYASHIKTMMDFKIPAKKPKTLSIAKSQCDEVCEPANIKVEEMPLRGQQLIGWHGLVNFHTDNKCIALFKDYSTSLFQLTNDFGRVELKSMKSFPYKVNHVLMQQDRVIVDNIVYKFDGTLLSELQQLELEAFASATTIDPVPIPRSSLLSDCKTNIMRFHWYLKR